MIISYLLLCSQFPQHVYISAHWALLLLLKHANHITSQGPCTFHFSYWESSILKNSHLTPSFFVQIFTPKPLPQTPALITLHKYQFPSFPLLSVCLSALFFPCTCLLLTAILFIWCLYLPLEYIFQKRGKLFYLFLHSQS